MYVGDDILRSTVLREESLLECFWDILTFCTPLHYVRLPDMNPRQQKGKILHCKYVQPEKPLQTSLEANVCRSTAAHG